MDAGEATEESTATVGYRILAHLLLQDAISAATTKAYQQTKRSIVVTGAKSARPHGRLFIHFLRNENAGHNNQKSPRH
jgi:hypothetical protein